MRFRLRLGAGESRTLWFAVAGSERGPARAVTTFEQVIQAPWRLLRAKIDRRLMLGRRTRVSIPGDRLLQKGIEWSKQNLADSIQVARDLEIREVDAGTSYPEAEGRVPKVRFLGAGFPD